MKKTDRKQCLLSNRLMKVGGLIMKNYQKCIIVYNGKTINKTEKKLVEKHMKTLCKTENGSNIFVRLIIKYIVNTNIADKEAGVTIFDFGNEINFKKFLSELKKNYDEI